ncbi:uncharacterized protein SRS1_11605 [Sporisorium reilianum f. sp. reilianum]|uniref:RRM domain-containing protein n=1 Tax=Sporisorium reilianum f. sp. reilianum TaxID=72559 RepID=A0A2N8U6D6_9BASI|nr:uncharacterized protein SRS1_11605 [Sporisorium reilianum f. sp. reilianum]
MRAGRERAQRNLYVLNLPLDATTDQFEALFAQFGPVEHAVILATLDHLARRRGFILMSDPAQARDAIEHLNGHEWHHYRIEVSFAIVQRSGTPFSHESVDSPAADERSMQVSTADTVNQSTIDRYRVQGLPEHQASQREDGSALLLSGLDASVITSSAMIMALTEPFGHIVELRHAQSREHHVDRRQILVEYCCSSSASLAQLSLDGLVIGSSQVQAAIVRPRLSAAYSSRDTETSHDAVMAFPSGVPVYESAPDSTDQLDTISHAIPSSGMTSGMTPRQSDMTPRRSSPTLAQAIETRACDSSPHPWRKSDTFYPAASKNDNEDPILVDRRDRPRPIGDERQKATFKKP